MRHLEHHSAVSQQPTLPIHRGPQRQQRRKPTSRKYFLLLLLPLLVVLPTFLLLRRSSSPEAPAVDSEPPFRVDRGLPADVFGRGEGGGENKGVISHGFVDSTLADDSSSLSPPPPAAASAAAVSHPATGTHDKRCEAYEVHTDTDLLHGDLDTAPAAKGVESLGACCALCADRYGCVGLTLTPMGDCWLKKTVASPMKQRGLTSAFHVSLSAGLGKTHAAAASAASAGEATAVEATQQQQQRKRKAEVAASNLPHRAKPARKEPASPVVPIDVGPGCSSDVAVGCMPSPAVVVMSHDRPEMTRRCLDILLSLPLVEKFTVYVSEDANSRPVRAAAEEYGGRVKEVLSSTPPAGHNAFQKRGLYKISQHFRSALEATLVERGHSHAIMIEDDLLLSPDFLLLFWSGAWLLKADPSVWCISAWNDQGFTHTTADATRLLRTGYFPGLGWMISSDLWHELRVKWPEAPTTGWDHWMRLTSTSKGRECVAPEINRSRHASKRGTNVLDNKPFERFTYETAGVPSFGDLSYLLHEQHEKSMAQAVKSAKRLQWPSAWGGGKNKEEAMWWVESLPSSPPQLLLYTREEYRDLAKPLGLWGENPRAFHNGTITLHPPSGGTLFLADKRHSPYIEEHERYVPPPSMRQLKAAAGVSCDTACKTIALRCDGRVLEWGNTCEAMAHFFPCEGGCGHQVGPELPAYASHSSLDTYQQCLISDIALSTCAAAFAKTERLCTCV